jgi:iron complex transport system substrate-binding protein
MKKKNKMLALLGMVVVLCSVFLVALPATAIAAEEDDYVLGVYGNANEDDTIDMRDLTYVKLIFFGKKPETELSDAKYDGKINPLDFIQIKLIIVGKEKELTVVQTVRGDAVTIRRPVKRVIPEHITSLVPMRVLDAEDMIISIGSTSITNLMGPIFLQDLAELPTIGTYGNPDYEAILSLTPIDLYIAYRSRTLQEKLPGVPIFYTGYRTPYNPENLTMDMRKLGYILDRRDQAEEYIDWCNGYLDMIKERTAGLSEDEKPRVYVFYTQSPTTSPYSMCMGRFMLTDIAGGITIGADLVLPGRHSTTVDPEWVIEQNPDFIIASTALYGGAYETDDTSDIIAMREGVLNRPELVDVAAVKEGRVYIMNVYAVGLFPNNLLSIVYLAKWFHPDLFEDLDPQAVHQEYLDRFSPLDFNVKEHGVFVYPEPS